MGKGGIKGFFKEGGLFKKGGDKYPLQTTGIAIVLCLTMTLLLIRFFFLTFFFKSQIIRISFRVALHSTYDELVEKLKCRCTFYT